MVDTLFEDLKKGLTEAVEYETGQSSAKVKKYIIDPVKRFSNDEIREVRMNAGMTQAVFAAYMGVSKKTVEAWECGRIHPSGPANRLIAMLNSNNGDISLFIKIEEQKKSL